MGWIKKVQPEHGCSLPWTIPSGVCRGSVWQCDDCNLQYELVNFAENSFGYLYPEWEELIP